MHTGINSMLIEANLISSDIIMLGVIGIVQDELLYCT